MLLSVLCAYLLLILGVFYYDLFGWWTAASGSLSGTIAQCYKLIVSASLARSQARTSMAPSVPGLSGSIEVYFDSM